MDGLRFVVRATSDSHEWVGGLDMALSCVDVCRGVLLVSMKMPMAGAPPEARLISMGKGELAPPISGSHTVSPTVW